MSKQLICPVRNDKVCLEENCAWWILKGASCKKQNKEKHLTVYEHEGCCSVRSIAERSF
jgi:hypothetical protein